MRKPFAVLLLLLVATTAPAQVRVKGAASYAPYDPIVLKASDVTSAKASFLWDVSEGAKTVEAGDTLYVWAPPGSYKVTLTAIDFEAKKVERAKFTFKVEGKTPGPDPPNPPDPTPVSGLKVLIVFESSNRTTYPAGQLAVMAGKPMHDWLNAHCSEDKSLGYGKAWAVWDKDTDGSKMPKFWQDALKRPQASLPWIVVGDGADRIVYEGALPADTAATIALLSKFSPNPKTLPTPLRKAG